MTEDISVLEDVVVDILDALDEVETKTKNADSIDEMKNIVNNLKSKTPKWQQSINNVM